MDLTTIFQTLHDVFSALGVVVVAATAVMHALRGLAKVLKKAAEVTPTTQDDEIIAEADKGLEAFAAKLDAFANALKRVAIYRK